MIEVLCAAFFICQNILFVTEFETLSSKETYRFLPSVALINRVAGKL